MREMPEQTNRRVWWWAAGICLLLLLLYVLSVGPLLLYRGSGPGRENFFTRELHRPLWKAASNPLIGKPLVAYLNLWLRHDEARARWQNGSISVGRIRSGRP